MHQPRVGHRAPVQADAIGIDILQHFLDALSRCELQVFVEIEEGYPLAMLTDAIVMSFCHDYTKLKHSRQNYSTGYGHHFLSQTMMPVP